MSSSLALVIPTRRTKKSEQRFSRRSGRRIVVDGIPWKYSVGKRGLVLVFSADGRRLVTNAPFVKGITFAEWDHAVYTRSSDGEITDAEMRRWIGGELLKLAA